MPLFDSPRRSARSAVSVLALAFVPALVAPFPDECVAQEHRYIPLAVGNRWIYDNTYGFHEEQHVAGTIELFGRTAFVMRYENSTVNEGLENYWIADESGDLYVCGFHRTLQSFGALYDPPLLWLDAPLEQGKTWIGTASVFDYPSLDPAGSLALGSIVVAHGTVDVPAGSYEAYAVGQFTPSATAAASAAATVSLLSTQGFEPDGTRIDMLSGFVGPTYYSDGVGVVIYDSYTLSSEPVPAGAGTWGRLKASYR
jgi:hypothetical protein